MDARSLLEQLQRNTIDIDENKFSYDPTSAETIEQLGKLGGIINTDYKYDKEKKAVVIDTHVIPILLPKLPTQYQDVITYIGFYDAFHSLFSVLPHFIQRWNKDSQLNNVPESAVIFGTVENPDFQSSVYRVNDEFLIVFNNGLLSFINEMSTIVTYFLFIDDEISYYNLINNLKNKPEYIKEFIEKIMAYYLFSHTWWGQQRKVEYSKQFWEIRDTIQKESIKFTCAHELGHIVHRHFDNDFLEKKDLDLWKKEYQADSFATLIMLQEYRIHPVFPSVAIALVISVIECLDRMNGDFYEKNLDQHPLSYVRRNRMGGMAHKVLGIEASNAFLLTTGLFEILWNEFMEFVQYLWFQEKVEIEKNNFETIQNILHSKYNIQDKDYDSILDTILSGQQVIVKGFYNKKYRDGGNDNDE